MSIYIRWPAPLVTKKWIFHNADLWLISLSSDWTNWLTISDKNLWATTVSPAPNTTDTSCYWYYYQWWNCYWFPTTWAVTTSSTAVDTTWYWPNNYYSSSTFVTTWNWMATDNYDLWWWTTGTLAALKWPCDEWWHIPTSTEMSQLMTTYSSIYGSTSNMNKLLFLPCNWFRDQSSWNTSYTRQYWYIATATLNNWQQKLLSFSSSWNYTVDSKATGRWCWIRPFKNVSVQPDKSWEVVYM